MNFSTINESAVKSSTSNSTFNGGDMDCVTLDAKLSEKAALRKAMKSVVDVQRRVNALLTKAPKTNYSRLEKTLSKISAEVDEFEDATGKYATTFPMYAARFLYITANMMKIISELPIKIKQATKSEIMKFCDLMKECADMADSVTPSQLSAFAVRALNLSSTVICYSEMLQNDKSLSSFTENQIQCLQKLCMSLSELRSFKLIMLLTNHEATIEEIVDSDICQEMTINLACTKVNDYMSEARNRKADKILEWIDRKGKISNLLATQVFNTGRLYMLENYVFNYEACLIYCKDLLKKFAESQIKIEPYEEEIQYSLEDGWQKKSIEDELAERKWA